MRAVKGSFGHSPKEMFGELEGPRSTVTVEPRGVSFQVTGPSELGPVYAIGCFSMGVGVG